MSENVLGMENIVNVSTVRFVKRVRRYGMLEIIVNISSVRFV